MSDPAVPSSLGSGDRCRRGKKEEEKGLPEGKEKHYIHSLYLKPLISFWEKEGGGKGGVKEEKDADEHKSSFTNPISFLEKGRGKSR